MPSPLVFQAIYYNVTFALFAMTRNSSFLSALVEPFEPLEFEQEEARQLYSGSTAMGWSS
jgi:hypothetical protein